MSIHHPIFVSSVPSFPASPCSGKHTLECWSQCQKAYHFKSGAHFYEKQIFLLKLSLFASFFQLLSFPLSSVHKSCPLAAGLPPFSLTFSVPLRLALEPLCSHPLSICPNSKHFKCSWQLTNATTPLWVPLPFPLLFAAANNPLHPHLVLGGQKMPRKDFPLPDCFSRADRYLPS